MKKLVRIVLIALPIAVILVWVVVSLLLDTAAKRAIETVLPGITGTPVSVKSVNLSLLSGRGAVNGFVIGNPKGFQTERAFSVVNASVDIDVSSLLRDTLVIEEIIIDGPQVTYEFDQTQSNIGKIKENVDKFSPKKEAPAESRAGRKVIIKRLVVRNGKVTVAPSALKGQGVTVLMSTVEVKGIGEQSGGAVVGQAVAAAFDPLTQAIEKAAAKGKEQLKDALDAFQKGTTGLIDPGGKEVKDKVDKVKDLFK